MISWYAIHTRPQAELKALQNLLRQGYDAYLPRYRARIRHARRVQTTLRPLFPRYLFAGLDRAAMRWRPILSTFGVCDIVRAGDEPALVPPAIIKLLRDGESSGAFDRISPRRLPQLGDRVRINAGAFDEMIGRLVEVRDGDRVVVLLDLLGRAVATQLPAEVVVAA